MIKTIAIGMFFAVLLGYCYLLVSTWLRRPKSSDGGMADTDIMNVEYRGEWITMLHIEYLNRWLYMTREEKSAMLDAQKKALKAGKIKKVKAPNGYYTVSTELGKDIGKRAVQKIQANESSTW